MKRARDIFHELFPFKCMDGGEDHGWSHRHECDELHRWHAEHIAESKAREEALRKEIERGAVRERALGEAMHRAQDDAAKEAAERDRLKTELAEARRLIADAPNFLDDLPEAAAWAQRRKAFLAAPSPAESPCTASAGKCNSPKACGEAGRCIDARMRETLAESTGVPGCAVSCTQCSYRAVGLTFDEASRVDDEHKAAHEAAPPDDIRDAKCWAVHEDHERRLQELEATRTPERLYSDAIKAALHRESGTATTAPAAPQEQAGHARYLPHAFVPMGTGQITSVVCAVCPMTKDNPIHTGARP